MKRIKKAKIIIKAKMLMYNFVSVCAVRNQKYKIKYKIY